MPTEYAPPQKQRRPWKDKDGIWTYYQHPDETIDYTINLTDELDSSETLSSATFTGYGVTLSATSVSSPSVLFTVANSPGEVKIEITTSTQVRVVRRRFTTGSGRRDDYGNLR